MNTIIHTELDTDESAAAVGLSSYWDDAQGVRVHLIDTSAGPLLGYAGVLMDNTTDQDGLFVCISQDVPLERRPGVVRALIVHWARKFDAAHAEGQTVWSAVAE